MQSVFLTGAVALSTRICWSGGVSPARQPPAAGLEEPADRVRLSAVPITRTSCEFGITADRRELLSRILKGLGGSSIVLAALYFQFRISSSATASSRSPRSLAVALVVSWRVTFYWLARSFAPRKRF